MVFALVESHRCYIPPEAKQTNRRRSLQIKVRIMKEMGSKRIYGQPGRAYLALLVRKGLLVKATFEQTWKKRENEPILGRAGKSKSQGLEAERQTWGVWGTESKPVWLEPSELGGVGRVVKGVREPRGCQIIDNAAWPLQSLC